MTSHGWQPLTNAKEAAPVLEAVHAIAGDLTPARVPLSSKREMAEDSLGAALFFTYLFESLGEEEWADTATLWLDRAVQVLSEQDMAPALHGGFPGAAWVSEHLGKRLFDNDPADEDPNADIDEALLELVSTRPWTGSYDLLQGLTGIGTYFLERLPRSSARLGLSEIVRRLEELSESCEGGCRWLTKPEDLPPWQQKLFLGGHYNLGVAHGIPAVIGLLAAVCGARIDFETTYPLLASAVGGLLATRLPEGKGSVYPSLITKEDVSYPSRLAWCYGDAGIAACLLASARVVGDSDWERAALEAGRAAAQRTLDNAQIADPDLCHGAAGLLQVFNRLYQATGEDVFRAAAKYWLAVTLEFREPGAWIGGFWGRPYAGGGGEPLGPPEKAPARDLLEGASGVGLALLAASSSISPDWDRLLMISLRQSSTQR